MQHWLIQDSSKAALPSSTLLLAEAHPAGLTAKLYHCAVQTRKAWLSLAFLTENMHYVLWIMHLLPKLFLWLFFFAFLYKLRPTSGVRSKENTEWCIQVLHCLWQSFYELIFLQVQKGWEGMFRLVALKCRKSLAETWGRAYFLLFFPSFLVFSFSFNNIYLPWKEWQMRISVSCVAYLALLACLCMFVSAFVWASRSLNCLTLLHIYRDPVYEDGTIFESFHLKEAVHCLVLK